MTILDDRSTDPLTRFGFQLVDSDEAIGPIDRVVRPMAVPDLAPPQPQPQSRPHMATILRASSQRIYPEPPTDAERDRYLVGGQRRYLLLLQYLAFLGVLISFIGFATSSYWTFIFGVPLVIMAVEQSIALYTSTFPRAIELPDHRRTVSEWNPDRHPSVDVYLPTCGEDLDILANTMKYLAALQWDGPLQTYVLDDSRRESVRALAEQYSFIYLTRANNDFKKAGNLHHAFGKSHGEFIALFDADFVPRHDFLNELIPYFDTDDVGIVQSPQYFSTSKNLHWIERTAGATQELFYRFIQPSRDRHGAAICVGSSAVYRRSALEAIGGFPLIQHSEDVVTGFRMATMNIATQYVPTVVSKGLCPEHIDKFIAQQYRWCEGSMELLANREFHVNEALSLPARLSYWSGFLYNINTAFNAVLLPLPAVIMVWFYPEWVRPANFLWLVGALVLWFILYPMIMTGRWRIEILRLQTVYGFAHVFSIYHVLVDRTVEWHPTGSKVAAPIATTVKRFYTVYLGATSALLAAGLILRCLHGFSHFWPMVGFSLLNLYIAGPLVYGGLRDELLDSAGLSSRQKIIRSLSVAQR
jgi:cellulose synthase (UDP-forming)